MDEIMRKHELHKVPSEADCPPKARFHGHNFKDFFNRGGPWLSECQQAAAVIRNQLDCLKRDSLAEFEEFLVDQERQAGVSTFPRLARMFVNTGVDIETYEKERAEKEPMADPAWTGNPLHKSTDVLLTVPRYRDLIQDQDTDESDSGPSVISTAAGWRAVMNQWISDARTEEAEAAKAAKVKVAKAAKALESGSEAPVDSDSDDDETTAPTGPAPIPRWSKWKKRTLAELFGGSQKKHTERLSQEEIDAEAVLMKGLADAERRAEAEEDAWLDDGAVEIPSEDEYVG
ncbi:hypothetical protein B0H13DRAFT_1910013 [Mycena leptocephala]|nr:hypothetical protein B0H13DRAFT_1910013 [Mycena leptocephala]